MPPVATGLRTSRIHVLCRPISDGFRNQVRPTRILNVYRMQNIHDKVLVMGRKRITVTEDLLRFSDTVNSYHSLRLVNFGTGVVIQYTLIPTSRSVGKCFDPMGANFRRSMRTSGKSINRFDSSAGYAKFGESAVHCPADVKNSRRSCL